MEMSGVADGGLRQFPVGKRMDGKSKPYEKSRETTAGRTWAESPNIRQRSWGVTPGSTGWSIVGSRPEQTRRSKLPGQPWELWFNTMLDGRRWLQGGGRSERGGIVVTAMRQKEGTWKYTILLFLGQDVEVILRRKATSKRLSIGAGNCRKSGR